MNRALMTTTSVILTTALLGCSSGGGSSGNSSSASTAPGTSKPATTTPSATTPKAGTGTGPVTTRPATTTPAPKASSAPKPTSVTPVTQKPTVIPVGAPKPTTPTTPTSRGGSGVATGVSTQGTLQISLSPSSGAAGEVIAIQMSGQKASAQIAMGLMDSTGNWVKDQTGTPIVVAQALNPNNAKELDFQVPRIAIGTFSCVVEELDAASKVLDYAIAPFKVTATATPPSTTPNAPAGATTNGTSIYGSLQVSVTPGAGVAGDWVTVNLVGFDPNTTAFAYVQLVSAGGTPIQVSQALDQQVSNFPTSLALDFQVPQAAGGTYVVDVQVLDASQSLLDSAQAPFVVNGGTTTTTPASYATTTGHSSTNGYLQFTVAGGGAPGATIAVTITGRDNPTDPIAFGFYDASGNSIPAQASGSATNANEVDFVVPQTADGNYQVLVEEQDATGKAIDDAVAAFVVSATGTAPAAPAGSATGVSSYGGQLTFDVAPAGGAPGTAVAIVLQGINYQGDGVGVGLFDSNNNPVPGARFTANASNPAQIDFMIPAATDGVYTLLVQEQDATGQDLDDAVAQFTIASTPGSTTTVNPAGTTAATGPKTLAGNLTIGTINPGRASVGSTVAITLQGLTSANVSAYLVDAANPSATPIRVTQGQVNQATSSAASIEIDFVVPQAPAGNYVLVVNDAGQTPGTQPVGSAEVGLAIN